MIQKPFRDRPFSVVSWQSILEVSRGAIFTALLFAILLGVNLLQMLSMLILPFSRKAFRVFNRGCANFWWGSCVWTAETFYRSRLVVTGDIVPPLENAIVIANHQQMPDIFAIMMFAKTKGRLGDLKWFVKDVLKYVPGVGWGMLFLDCLFVKRNWDSDREKIENLFSKFSKDNIPIWLVSFVEGTRIKPAKVSRSQEYAKAKGLPHLNNVLLPRTKGFISCVEGLKNHCQAIYDLTIIYPKGIPTLWQIAKGTVREIHLHVKRYPINLIPREAGSQNQWLLQRFEQKDQYISEYFRTPRNDNAVTFR